MFRTQPDDVDSRFLTYCIESVLIRIGRPEYEKVASLLEQRYNFSISDCYKNPAFLRDVLYEIFGNSYHTIINEIKKEFGELGSKRYFDDFITILSKEP